MSKKEVFYWILLLVLLFVFCLLGYAFTFWLRDTYPDFFLVECDVYRYDDIRYIPVRCYEELKINL